MLQFKNILQFSDRVRHCVLSRHEKLEDAQKNLGAAIPPIQFESQLHGADSIIVKCEKLSKNGDALMTNKPGLPILIRTADCASVMLFDPVKNVIANIHAGWRGTAQKIVHATIQKMHEAFGCNARDLMAGISPSIGSCCAVFTKPYEELPKFLHTYITEENTFNLWAAIEGQLCECGVKNIENPRICTMCNPEDFYSYRRGDKEKRSGTAIMLV
ncbi:MAG: polyphenol oxidase family protein [Patescibacteria group bacterium]